MLYCAFGGKHIDIMEKFVNDLDDKGFGYIDNHGYMINYRFFDSTDTDAEQRYKDLISKIDDMLKDKKPQLNIVEKNFKFNLSFDYENHVCTLTDFESFGSRPHIPLNRKISDSYNGFKKVKKEPIKT